MTERAASPPGGERFVITLVTSSLPMPVKLAAELDFPGFSVFRTRTVEDGRERFRLHLGYLRSMTEAQTVLAALRTEYPSAMISALPAAPSGSLDDTLNTAFSLVRGPVAALVPSAAAGAPPTLTPAEVAGALAPQRYAVQLEWSLQPIEVARVPRLGIFRAYRLYSVSVTRQGTPEHGLRLGFFKSLDSARQVADYVRHDFRCASVVPVSYREYSRASGLASAEAAAPPPPAAVAPAEVHPATALPVDPPVAVVPAPAGGKPPAANREQLLARLGADDLEVDGGARATLTVEERELLLRRPQRGLGRW
ncbi:MAG: hypothetical protein JSR73_14005 [Proteobacteria bacterium]|nr:hypothetical protein [Pseudomonadota bacterium]